MDLYRDKLFVITMISGTVKVLYYVVDAERSTLEHMFLLFSHK